MNSKYIKGLFPFGIYIVITMAIEGFIILSKSDIVWAMAMALYTLWIIFLPIVGLLTFSLGRLTVKIGQYEKLATRILIAAIGTWIYSLLIPLLCDIGMQSRPLTIVKEIFWFIPFHHVMRSPIPLTVVIFVCFLIGEELQYRKIKKYPYKILEWICNEYGEVISFKDSYSIFGEIIAYGYQEEPAVGIWSRYCHQRYNTKHFSEYQGYIAYQGGMVTDEDSDEKRTLVKMNEMRYGYSNLRYSGGEVQATYNALFHKGLWIDVRNIVASFEKQGEILFGEFCITPMKLCDYLNDWGISAALYTSEASNKFDEYLNGGVGILTFWWKAELVLDKQREKFLIHTVMVQSAKAQEKIYMYNMHSDKLYNEYQSINYMFSEEGAIPISLIVIE